MAADPMLIISARIISARPGLALDHPQARTIRSAVADYWALTKPEVSFLIAIATFTGFYLALPASVPDLPWLRLMNTLIGYTAGRKRHWYVESIYRTWLRCPDAPDCAATARCRQVEAFAGFMVRDNACFYWGHLSRDSRQFACESARACYAAVLLISVHSAQTKNTCVCPGRRPSWCRASSGRLGSSIGQVEFGSVDTLRHSVPVAVPAFHGNRVDVSRRLRSRGLLRAAPEAGERSSCGFANHAAPPGFASRQCAAGLSRPAQHFLLHRRFAPEFGVFLLRDTIRALQIQRSCAPTPFGIHHLSSIAICADHAF